MATITTMICDRHDAIEERVDVGVETTVLKLGREETEADLCKECRDEARAALDTFFTVGRKVGKAPAPRASTGRVGGKWQREEPDMENGNFACRWDGECGNNDGNGFKSATARAVHESRGHNYSHRRMLEEQAAQDGTTPQGRVPAKKAPAKKAPAKVT